MSALSEREIGKYTAMFPREFGQGLMLPLVWKCYCMKMPRCMLVPFRVEGQDVVIWMEVFVRGPVGDLHRKSYPTCRTDKLEFVAFPVPPGSPGLGMKPKTLN